MGRRLYDFFEERFKSELPSSKTMQDAFQRATDKIESDLKFTPYSSWDSFNALRKQRKKAAK